MWLAWHVAAFQRSKRLPDLKSLYIQEKPRPQTWQEQYAIMEAYAARHNKALEMKKKLESRDG